MTESPDGEIATGDSTLSSAAPMSRRAVLGGGAVLAGTALGGVVAGYAAASHAASHAAASHAAAGASHAEAEVTTTPTSGTGVPVVALHGQSSEPFHGAHQAGIVTAQQAYGVFLGLDLRSGIGAQGVAALLTMLSDDAARLTSGEPPLGAFDAFPAGLPSRLTVTFGFGAGLFDAVGRPAACPPIVRHLPAFSTDKLQARWGQTDLVLQVCAEDMVTLSYAVRRILRDATSFATVTWTQRGFVSARGTEADGTTARNLMGMRDGTANERDPAERDVVVWSAAGAHAELDWMAGGSQLVIRRMRIDMSRWDDLEVSGKEAAFGRRIADGSPLTGSVETDRVDRAATDAQGFRIIATNAHAGMAQARVPAERMLRRAYNYDDGPMTDGRIDEGLIFVAYQADLATAFVPVQKRLATGDSLNTWATHVGSAAYAVPPGAAQGSWVGAALFA